MPIEVLVLTVGYKRPQYLYRSKGPFHHHLIAGGERQGDIEKILENIVYQQLVRMGYAVSVGQLRAGEVDFVCTKSNERLYVQVAYLIDSEETEKREFGSLDNIKDNYPKYVIFMTPLVRRSDRQRVVHLGLREFLKNGFEKKLP